MDAKGSGKEAGLRSINFGARVAEEEIEQLSRYFVATDQWTRVYEGAVDIVYGAKGSGKSAIYALLNAQEDDLFDRGVLLIATENVRGTPVFSQLTKSGDVSEYELQYLWKLYFLSLLAHKLIDYKLSNEASKRVVKELRDAGLLPAEFSLVRALRSVLDYATALVK